MDDEMMRALEADGEKLRALTGEDHGPWDFAPWGLVPCPHCFESSGYEARQIPATWYEPGYPEADYTRRCPHCDGTGLFEADEPAHAADTGHPAEGDAP